MKKLKLVILPLMVFICSFSMNAQDNLDMSFDAFDTNKNGSISFYEWKIKKRENERNDQQLMSLFSKLDKNRSRSITEDEFIAFYPSSKPSHANKPDNKGNKMNESNANDNRTSLNKKSLNYEKILSRFDTDNNGTINFYEWRTKKRKKKRTDQQLRKSFDRVDSNNSGDITLKELKDNFLINK